MDVGVVLAQRSVEQNESGFDQIGGGALDFSVDGLSFGLSCIRTHTSLKSMIIARLLQVNSEYSI